ncbi:MAG TPA: hypothetical protein VGN55_21215 [Xanthobacteraceae bacterium]|jgi:hypothetical protein
MRADYATSDLISRVNADWINAVLVNREFDRADAGEGAAGDLTPQPGSEMQIIPVWPKPARPATKSRQVQGPVITLDPIAPHSRHRSTARRIAERMALAVTALGVVWAGVRMAPEPRDVKDAVSVSATYGSPEQVAPISTGELQPGWLLPEILYGPAMASSPISAPRSAR